MPADPLFYLVGLSVVFLIGLGKGAFGGGLAVLGAPALALVVDPITATVMMAPIVSATDPFGMMAFPPRTWSWPDLKWLFPGTIVGLCMGAGLFVFLDPRYVTLCMAMITLWFTARFFLSRRPEKTDEIKMWPGLALACGFISGCTTFIAHAGGPPIFYYLVHRQLPKTIYAGTLIGLFVLSNTLKLVMYFALAGADRDAMIKALVLIPAIPLGVYVGKKMHDRLDERRLYFWCYLLVGVVGLRLLFESLQQIFAT